MILEKDTKEVNPTSERPSTPYQGVLDLWYSRTKRLHLAQVIKILSSSNLYCEINLQGILSRASGHLLLFSILLRMQVNYRISKCKTKADT